MFQTFTGSSRRPRQVNLSGRKSGETAVQFAQQERERRQRERDKLVTARLLQRLWRGHSVRKQVRQQWRDEWDFVEGPGGEDAYSSQEEALEQLLRFLYFARLQDGKDVERLQRYMTRLQLSLQNQDIICADGPWPMAYLRLRKLVLAAIPSARGELLFELETIAFIGEQIPEYAAKDTTTLYQTMAGVVHLACFNAELDTTLMTLIIRILTAPLQSLTATAMEAYESFACHFLALPNITESPFNPKWLNSLAEHVNYKLLASSLAAVVSNSHFVEYAPMKNSGSRLSLLGCFIYFHRYAHKFQNAQAYSSHKDFVHVISVLLSSVADDVNLDSIQNLDMGEDDSPVMKNGRSRSE